MRTRIFGKMLNSEVLKFYKPSLEELLRSKKHTLSAAEERIMGALSDVLGSAGEVYETLTDADMRFPLIKDQHGKKHHVPGQGTVGQRCGGQRHA